MTEHTDIHTYTEPVWGGLSWIIEERNADDEVTAEYGYPTESAALAAYRALTGETDAAPDPDPDLHSDPAADGDTDEPA
jgi:hypothetical protein